MNRKDLDLILRDIDANRAKRDRKSEAEALKHKSAPVDEYTFPKMKMMDKIFGAGSTVITA